MLHDVAVTNAYLPAVVPAITRKRLWFLYCFVGLIKAEIEDLTGWTRGQIDSRLRKWSLTMWSETYIETDLLMRNAIAKAFGISLEATYFDPGRLNEMRCMIRERMRNALKTPPIDWAAIDALPEQLWRD
jgi:hypothetical protein